MAEVSADDTALSWTTGTDDIAEDAQITLKVTTTRHFQSQPTSQTSIGMVPLILLIVSVFLACAVVAFLQNVRQCRRGWKVRRINQPESVEVSDNDVQVQPRDASRRSSLDSNFYHEPISVSPDYVNYPYVALDDSLALLPVTNDCQGQGQMPPDCPQPSTSSEDAHIPTECNQSPSSPTQSRRSRISQVIGRQGSPRQDNQRPSTSKSAGQETSIAIATEIFTGSDFAKQHENFPEQCGPHPDSLSETCPLMPEYENISNPAKDDYSSVRRGLSHLYTTEQGFHRPTCDDDKDQNPEEPPKRCGRPKSTGKRSSNAVHDTSEPKILSVLKGTFGPDTHITGVWQEGAKLHVSLELNLEQVSPDLKRSSHGFSATEDSDAPPDYYLCSNFRSESNHVRNLQSLYVDAWSSGSKETAV